MKKYGFLLVMVLMMSTTAWGSLASVWTCPESPDCDDMVKVYVKACVPGDCEVACVKKMCIGNMIIVDIYLDCMCACGSTQISEYKCIGKLCPGTYSVFARVWCSHGGCRPRVCALGSTFFRVAPCCP